MSDADTYGGGFVMSGVGTWRGPTYEQTQTLHGLQAFYGAENVSINQDGFSVTRPTLDRATASDIAFQLDNGAGYAFLMTPGRELFDFVSFSSISLHYEKKRNGRRDERFQTYGIWLSGDGPSSNELIGPKAKINENLDNFSIAAPGRPPGNIFERAQNFATFLENIVIPWQRDEFKNRMEKNDTIWMSNGHYRLIGNDTLFHIYKPYKGVKGPSGAFFDVN